MANWANPTVTSNYITFVTEIKDRDVDAITLQLNAVTTPPVGAIKLLRSPVKFQEWSGSIFNDLILTLGGGGTGSATASGARTNLGLGTMAIQNATAVALTGGTIAGVSMSGAISFVGTFSATPTSSSQNAISITGKSQAQGLAVFSSGASGQNYGVFIQAGTTSADSALHVRTNAAADILTARGDRAVLIPKALVIPVGADMWA